MPNKTIQKKKIKENIQRQGYLFYQLQNQIFPATMNNPDSTRKFPNRAIRPTKHEQTTKNINRR